MKAPRTPSPFVIPWRKARQTGLASRVRFRTTTSTFVTSEQRTGVVVELPFDQIRMLPFPLRVFLLPASPTFEQRRKLPPAELIIAPGPASPSFQMRG